MSTEPEFVPPEWRREPCSICGAERPETALVFGICADDVNLCAYLNGLRIRSVLYALAASVTSRASLSVSEREEVAFVLRQEGTDVRRVAASVAWLEDILPEEPGIALRRPELTLGRTDRWVMVASILFDKPYEDVTRADRTEAKRRGYLLAYGGERLRMFDDTPERRRQLEALLRPLTEQRLTEISGVGQFYGTD